MGRPGIPNHKSKSGMVHHVAYHITQRIAWTFFTVIWWDLSNKDLGLNQPTEGFLCFFGDRSIYIIYNIYNYIYIYILYIYIYIRVNPNGKLVAWQFWDINYIISLAKVVCFRRVCKICYDVKTPTIQLYLWDISYPNQKNIKSLDCQPVPGFIPIQLLSGAWFQMGLSEHRVPIPFRQVSLIPCHPYKQMP